VRILLVSSSSGSRGGGEIFLLYLGEAFAAMGHTVALWVSTHARMDELASRFACFGEVLRDDYLNTYDHWHRGLWPGGRGSLAITVRWRQWRPDVLHFNKQNLEDGLDLLRRAGAQAAPAADTAHPPHLCTIHITQTARFLGARFAAWRDVQALRALRRYSGVLVAVAPERARELQALLGSPADIRTVLNGVPTSSPASPRSELRQREELSPADFAVVAVGRLEAQKSPLRFLDHAPRIRAATPAVQMRWIGSGRLAADWDRKATADNLNDFVKRIDWRNDVRQLLPAYDLFLHTAAFEGLPLAILEAMAAGLPCAIEHGVHGQLPAALQTCSVAVGDDTDWSGLLGDRAQLKALGLRAQSIVRSQFSTTAMARGYEQIYAELCRRR
jgi:glycosyltransferase involved in cell wall biosynthesis